MALKSHRPTACDLHGALHAHLIRLSSERKTDLKSITLPQRALNKGKLGNVYVATCLRL